MPASKCSISLKDVELLYADAPEVLCVSRSSDAVLVSFIVIYRK